MKYEDPHFVFPCQLVNLLTSQPLTSYFLHPTSVYKKVKINYSLLTRYAIKSTCQRSAAMLMQIYFIATPPFSNM